MGNQKNKNVKRSKKNKFKGIQRYAVKKCVQQEDASGLVLAHNGAGPSHVIPTASSRKLTANQPDEPVSACDDKPTGCRLIYLDMLSKALAEAHLCPEAHFELKEDAKKDGFNCTLILVCSECGEEHRFKTSPPLMENQRIAEINRLSVYAAADVGLARQGLENFAAHMNMPPPIASPNYQQHSLKLLEASTAACQEQMLDAVKRLKEVTHGGDNEIVDVAVSFDGTWAKRGHQSNIGVGVVISMVTGEVLDSEVLSKICKECKLKKKKIENEEEYKTWRDEHIKKSKCGQNYVGSSLAMEVEAAKRIWGRSIEKYGIRYKYMISDGDAKSFATVKNIYGEGEANAVVKLECVGHVGKRMRKALDKFRTDTKGRLDDGKYVGGQRGRLTGGENGVTKRLSKIYRNNILNNVDRESMRDSTRIKDGVEKMRRAIMAGLYHECKIADNSVRHQYCPEDGFCEYKKNGFMEDKAYHLDPIFLQLLEPIYKRLSDPELLKRCLPGYTQNQNESFNSLIWRRCPKYLWRGGLSVQVAVNLATLAFNSGSEIAHTKVLSKLGIVQGRHDIILSRRNDRKRLSVAQRDAGEVQKRRRKAEMRKRNVEEEEYIESEGVTYEMGGF